MSDTRDNIIDATMALIAERPLREVTLGAIASAAGVSLGELHRHFTTRWAILSAFAERIDAAVLEGDYSDMADESPRDRLFDVLMARLDALRPYRASLEALLGEMRRDPELALALNAAAMRSQQWMLAAAGVSPRGWRGRLAVQSLVVAFFRVLGVFLAEEDAGMPRTMAALDRELKRLESGHDRLARFFGSALRPDPAAAEPEAPAMPATATAAAGSGPKPEPPRPDPAAMASAEPDETVAEAAAAAPERRAAPRAAAQRKTTASKPAKAATAKTATTTAASKSESAKKAAAAKGAQKIARAAPKQRAKSSKTPRQS